MATFAPELSLVYDRYQDKPLAAFLRAPCCSRRPEAPVTHVLTPDESFAVRAFLRDAARHASTPAGEARRTPEPRLQR
jgi:hypothetical protein